MGVRRHEDLVCWQLAMKLRERVVAIVSNDRVSRDRRFCEQLLAAAGGATPNIAEGFARYSRPEFRRFLRYAIASLTEAKTHVEQGRQRGHLSIDEYEDIMRLARRASAAAVRLRQSIPGPPEEDRL